MARIGRQPLNRADIDNGPAGFAQSRHSRFYQHEGRCQIDRQCLLPCRQIHLLNAGLLHHACIIDQNIQLPACLCQQLIYGCWDGGTIRQIHQNMITIRISLTLQGK